MPATLESLDALERVGRALGDRLRAAILLELAHAPAYPAQLAESLGTTRANLSNHLTCLRGCGIVRAARQGRNVRYELADDRFAELLHQLACLALADHCDDCDGRRRSGK